MATFLGDFLGDDVLLSNDTARALYHGVARGAPVVDFHTHLSAGDIAADRVFATLTELWLEDDHYKWRAMRLAGVDEHLVSGDADPRDKFLAWAATVVRLVGNPLHLWTHLELRRVFGIDLVLTPATAGEVWEEANRQLPRCSARQLLAHFHVALLCTTDDPGDDLDAHRRLAAGDEATPRVLPTWRPDAAHRLLEDPRAWNAWAKRLSHVAGTAVEDLDSLLGALAISRRAFAGLGARSSDHGSACLPGQEPDRHLADDAVRRARQGAAPSPAGRQAVEAEVLALAAEMAHEDDSVQQLHLGARRDLSPRLLAGLGRDAGGDAIDDERQAPGLARLLGGLDASGRLARTVLYNSNPADNALFAAMAGTFSRSGVPSPVQWGPPWWFNDHEDGMRQHLRLLGAVGQLAGFVGMVTDSRSLLSFTRHELFRRVLCDVLGAGAETGRIPADHEWLSGVVGDICAGNAVAYFGFP